jgi:hypothetical protein
MTQPMTTCRTDASWTVKGDHWGRGFLAGPVDGLLYGSVAPLAPPRAAAAPPVPAPRTAPSTSLGHQQLGGR